MASIKGGELWSGNDSVCACAACCLMEAAGLDDVSGAHHNWSGHGPAG